MRTLLFALVSLSLASCQNFAWHPSPLLASDAANAPTYEMRISVNGKPQTADYRTLSAGSRWIEFGRIDEGTVYKPHGTVMTVEAANISEAYIVVRDGLWVGFWLPVENGFVPLEKAERVELQREAE